MKYGYAVKKNGILYTPGMEVPGDNPVKVEMSPAQGTLLSVVFAAWMRENRYVYMYC